MKKERLVLEREEVLEGLELVRDILFEQNKKADLIINTEFQERMLEDYLNVVDHLIMCVRIAGRGSKSYERACDIVFGEVRKNFEKLHKEALIWCYTEYGKENIMEDAFLVLLDFYKSVYDDDLLL